MATIPESPRPNQERITLAKVTRRLIPLMFVCYIFNILVRLNPSVAALRMQQDLGFDDRVYGLAAGIFFVGYFFFEVPANLALQKIGPRRWMAFIVMAWSIVAAAMVFVREPMTFYVLRFLLGVAEAGFFPGMVIYLTYWFPATIRARAAAFFMVATTIGGLMGGPIGSLCFRLEGQYGLRGWQWLFLLEGLPSFLLGFVVLRFLTNRPQEAEWLEPEERDWLSARLEREEEARRSHHDLTLFQALRHKKVLHLCAYFFVLAVCGNGFGFFAPKLLKERSGWSDHQVLWIGTIPGILSAVAMIAAAHYSDHLKERKRFVVIGQLVNAAGIALVGLVRTPFATLFAKSISGVGGASANAPFWAITSSFLAGTAAAGGIAFINSVGNLGGFFGPLIMGHLKKETGDYETGIFLMAIGLCFAALLAALIRHDRRLEYAEAVRDDR